MRRSPRSIRSIAPSTAARTCLYSEPDNTSLTAPGSGFQQVHRSRASRPQVTGNYVPLMPSRGQAEGLTQIGLGRHSFSAVTAMSARRPASNIWLRSLSLFRDTAAGTQIPMPGMNTHTSIAAVTTASRAKPTFPTCRARRERRSSRWYLFRVFPMGSILLTRPEPSARDSSRIDQAFRFPKSGSAALC